MIKKKKEKIVLKLLGVLFVIYMALFIANMSGYYESKIRDRVVVTENGIKEFEEKVKSGEEIDITSFLSNEGDNLTNGIESFVSGGMEVVSGILKSLF